MEANHCRKLYKCGFPSQRIQHNPLQVTLVHLCRSGFTPKIAAQQPLKRAVTFKEPLENMARQESVISTASTAQTLQTNVSITASSSSNQLFDGGACGFEGKPTSYSASYRLVPTIMQQFWYVLQRASIKWVRASSNKFVDLLLLVVAGLITGKT